MKKKRRVLAALFPFIATFGLYLSFSSRIESKPNHVGFWFILALGISIGVSLTLMIQLVKEKD